MQGGSAIAYGQIIYYNPKTSDLNVMLPWTSSSGIPQWQQVTSGGFPELVIDETVELEPQFRVYQLKPAQFDRNSIQLEEISLLKPALELSAYQDALFLAQNGLWTPACKWLQSIKQQQVNWSASAQAQMDLIQLYAQFTRNQAEQTWASPSQQVLANIIDGRWGKALQVFQSSPHNAQEVTTLLEADRGQLWNRVEAALRVNPKQPEVQAWGTLILAVQSQSDLAISWLKQQPQTDTSHLDYITNLLEHLDSAQDN